MPYLHGNLVCREALELDSDELERALWPRRRGRYERSPRACPQCRAHLAQMRSIVAEMGRVEPERLTDAARADLTDGLRHVRAEHEGDPEP